MTNPFADTYSGRRVLVTGHTGFKGSWLSLWLHHLGADVTGYSDEVPTPRRCSNSSGSRRESATAWATYATGAVWPRYSTEVRPDMVFHLAAQALVLQSHLDPVGTFETNTMVWSTCSNASANGPGSRLPCS